MDKRIAKRLLIGAAGGGKSLTAKAIALALKSKSVGKSDQRTAVWVDEIEQTELFTQPTGEDQNV